MSHNGLSNCEVPEGHLPEARAQRSSIALLVDVNRSATIFNLFSGGSLLHLLFFFQPVLTCERAMANSCIADSEILLCIIRFPGNAPYFPVKI